jgi:Mrp family chromosome partitioning ATPase/predicted Fe-Mo cluster-binding NifX family protein
MAEVSRRMKAVRRKIIVLSGKGGVGKSTVAVNLAAAAAGAGLKVGLLDVDVHGPSVPRLLGLQDVRPQARGESILPVQAENGLAVMSIGFLLGGRDDAVIWRGPMKFNLIRQFLADVEWGELDLLVVDSPPGTGDEPLSVVQLISNPDGAVVVTTPQEVAVADVRRCISFCRELSLPVLGVIENMSGFVCPYCGRATDVFGSGGGEQMAEQMGVPFITRVPMDPEVTRSGESGIPCVAATADNNPATAAFRAAVDAILNETGHETEPTSPERAATRYAVPLTGGKLSDHFGHCEQFALIDADAEAGEVGNVRYLKPPAHSPGALPAWLKENGVDTVIARGMGQRAQGLFAEAGIEVVTGAEGTTAEELVTAHLADTLEKGDNICDH